MDLISNKRSKSLRSGRTGGGPPPPPSIESTILELLGASEYWGTVLHEFWRTAAFTKSYMDKMKSEIEVMSGGHMTLDRLWLEQVAKKVKDYRANFRKGASEEFEALAYKHVCNLTELVLQTQSVVDLKRKGFESILDPLQAALDSFSGAEVENQKAALRSWFSNLQGEFSLAAFMEELSNINGSDEVSWSKLSKKFERIQGVEAPPHLVSALKDAVPTLFDQFAQKAGPLRV